MKDKAFILLISAGAIVAIVVSFYLLFTLLPYPQVEPTDEQNDAAADLKIDNKEVVYIGVVSRFPPPIIYQGYQPIADYLTETTDFRFELKLFPSYSDTVASLVEGEILAAFVGSLIYVESRAEFDIVPIIRPLNAEKEPYHRSVIITTDWNSAGDQIDLNGRTVALPSDEAFASNWFRYIYMRENQQNLEAPAEIRNFSYHHSVLFEVLKGNFDYGVVKDRVALEYQDRGIRIVASSPPIPSSPLVVSRDYDERIVGQMIAALLELDVNKEKFRSVLEDIDYEFINGFVRASETDYDELARLVEEHF